MDIESFYAEAKGLVGAVNDFANKYELVGQANADHVGFKCDSKETFERLRAMLEPESDFMYQSYISNRRIAVMRLKKPFETVLGAITTLELSDQKPDKSQQTGFDHMEVYPVGIEYDALAEKLRAQGTEIKSVERPHHTTYDIKLGDGYKLKLTRLPLVKKVKREEMA
jgi:predicted metalloenzyme YecM